MNETNQFKIGDLINYQRYLGASNPQFGIVLEIQKPLDGDFYYNYRIYSQKQQLEEWIRERWLDKVL
jgi:hypothetical protein